MIALLLVLAFTLTLLLGVIIGFIIASMKFKHGIMGTLHVETSDPEGPYLFLEIDKVAMAQISGIEYITLKIDTKNYISQK